MYELKRRKRAIGWLLLLGVFAFGAAASAATLVLKDGAVIHGEILSLEDGVYKVRSSSLGQVRVRKRDVRTIDHSGSATLGTGSKPSSGGVDPGEMQALQTRMMQDPSTMAKVQALQSDPQIKAVLADPEIMRALASGDYAALLNHPKIIALTNNSKVREVINSTQ